VVAAVTAASPLWFATRAAGVVGLVLLTAATVLGITVARRVTAPQQPRFVTALIHRNVSLFAVIFLGVHIVTAVADPFARLHAIDAVVPFTGAYRTVWLTFGVVSADIMLAVAITSLLRRRIGERAWRMIHWISYACWPMGIVHSFGTGTDATAPWMIGIAAACASAVFLAVIARLASGRWRSLPLRAGLGAMAVIITGAIAVWITNGPLQPNWAVASGTPAGLLKQGPSPQELAAQRNYPFSDPLVGTLTRYPGGVNYISLRDTTDPQITILISPPKAGEALPTVAISRNGHVVCTVAVRATTDFYSVCKETRFTITLFSGTKTVTGTLDASGPLR
jgi:methionine sulfoxide reductase heme-binding subunit